MFGLNESVGWHRKCAARMIIAVKKKKGGWQEFVVVFVVAMVL